MIAANREVNDLYKWQNKLLPLIVIVPALLMSVFIYLASVRMNKLESFIYNNDSLLISGKLPSPKQIQLNELTREKLAYINLYNLTQLEQYTIIKRYNQAGIMTMSTIYTKYLGFFTGMILAIVGALFIISKLQEPLTNIEGSVRETVRFKVLSSSPGIIFGVIGASLMIVTITTKGGVNVNDTPLYLNHYNLQQIHTNESPGNIDSAGISKLDTTLLKSDRISKGSAEQVDLNK